MKVLTFSGFLQEKFDFFLNGHQLSRKGVEIAKIFESLPLWRFIPTPASTGRPSHSRPPKGALPKPKEQTRLQKQLSWNLDEMVCELPIKCDWGCKINSQGNPDHWRGYKLHADFSDEGIPLSFMFTSASVHDSQVSIPLTLMSSGRATYLYELMDAGYDMTEIKTISKDCNHAPIIKPNNRRSKIKRSLDPASARRYRIRTTSERGFSELKDNYGVEKSKFRGYAKIKTHIGFAMIILTMRKIFQFGYVLEKVKKEKVA